MAGIVNTVTNNNSNESGKNYVLPLIVLTALFFMWGFITCMNDILFPYLQGIFSLSAAEAGLIQSAFFGAYFFISLFYFIISTNFGDPLTKIGYKNGIILGLLIAGIGCCLFYTAAEAKVFAVFLLALFVLASGIAILQIAANPYVALLGSSESSSSRLNLTQAFNSLGTTIAPGIGAMLIFSSQSESAPMNVETVKAPYLYLAATLFLIAIVFVFTKLPKFTGDKIEKGLEVLKFSHLTFGVIAIFMYVGGEVAIGSYMVKYFHKLVGYNEVTAAKFITFYWGGSMFGRFLGAISLTQKSFAEKISIIGIITAIAVAVTYFFYGIDIALVILALCVGNIIIFQIGKGMPARTLAIFAAMVILLLGATIITTGAVAMWSVLAIGLFNSIMFPTIFTLAIKDLGKYTSQGSSLLVMAIVGGAVVTPVMGVLIGKFGYQNAFILPMLCYAYILYYGVSGYKVAKVEYTEIVGKPESVSI